MHLDAEQRIDRLRIVLLMSSLGRGGAQRQAVATATGLRGRGHDVTFVVLRNSGGFDRDLREANVRVVELGSLGRLSGLRARLALLRLPAVRNGDVVYSLLPAANVTAAVMAVVRRRPTIVWGIRDSGVDLGEYGFATRLIARMADRLACRPELMICNSQVARRHYALRGYPDDRMCVIPNGIDVGRFQPDPVVRGDERRRRGMSDNDRLVLCLARGDPMKGHPDLIEAFGLLAPSHPHARLLLVGDHDEAFAQSVDRLARLAGITDRVRLEPGTDSPETLLAAADLLVLASRYGEGFPNVLAEALACGVPVVTTDVGDAAAVVGDDGLVVPPGDPAALADAISVSLESPPTVERAGQRVARIQREFSVERLIDRTEAALRLVVGPR